MSASARSGSFAYAARALEEEGHLKRWGSKWVSLHASWGPAPGFSLGPPRGLSEGAGGCSVLAVAGEEVGEQAFGYMLPERAIEL